jgi:hypothetical protein
MVFCLPFLYIGSVLGIKEESRLGVVQTLWNYIKVQGLQDKVDRRLIRADDKLRPVGYACFIQHNTMFNGTISDFWCRTRYFSKIT